MDRYTLVLPLGNDSIAPLAEFVKSIIVNDVSTCSISSRKCEGYPDTSVLSLVGSQHYKNFLAIACPLSWLNSRARRCESCGLDLRTIFCNWIPLSGNQEIQTKLDDFSVHTGRCTSFESMGSLGSVDLNFVSHALHYLADELPERGSFLLDAVLYAGSESFLPMIRECVHLMGALKRLELWHKAVIKLICFSNKDVDSWFEYWSEQAFVEKLCEDQLKNSLVLSRKVLWQGHADMITEQSTGKLRLHGCRLVHIDDCALDLSTWLDGVKVLHSAPKKCEGTLFTDSILDIVTVARVKNVPWHLMMPVRMHLICCVDSGISESEASLFGLAASVPDCCFIGRLRYDVRVRQERALGFRTMDWVKHIAESNAGDFEESDYREDLSQFSMMVIQYPKQTLPNGWLDVYCLRSHKDIEPYGFLHVTRQAASEKEMLSKLDSAVVSPDLRFPFADEEALRLMFSDEHLRDKATSILDQKSESDQLVLSDFRQDLHHARLDFIDSCIIALPRRTFPEVGEAPGCSCESTQIASGAELIPYTEWPERVAWHAQENITKVGRSISRYKSDEMYLGGLLKPGRSRTCHKTFEEVLTLFDKSGRCICSELKPIPLAANRFFKNVKTADAVKGLTFDQSHKLVGHGLDYCVDSLNALRLDSRLAKVQGRFVPDESMNLTSYLLRSCSVENAGKVSSPAKKRKGRTPVKKRPTEYGKREPCKTPSKEAQQPTFKENRRKFRLPVHMLKKASAQCEPVENLAKEGKETSELPHAHKGESRSERQKRRLRVIVEAVVCKHGKLTRESNFFVPSCERLFYLCMQFVKDLKTSVGLYEEMKKIAKANVKQVVEFEMRRI